MQIRVRVRDLEIEGQERRRVERRLRLAIGRHAAAVAVGHVTLSSQPGANGSTATCCRIHLRLRGGAPLTIEDAGADAATAVDRLAWRLEHRLSGSIARRRDAASLAANALRATPASATRSSGVRTPRDTADSQ